MAASFPTGSRSRRMLKSACLVMALVMCCAAATDGGAPRVTRRGAPSSAILRARGGVACGPATTPVSRSRSLAAPGLRGGEPSSADDDGNDDDDADEGLNRDAEDSDEDMAEEDSAGLDEEILRVLARPLTEQELDDVMQNMASGNDTVKWVRTPGTQLPPPLARCQPLQHRDALGMRLKGQRSCALLH